MSHTGPIPGKKRDRLLLLYDYLDQLGLSEEVEQVNYHGSTYQLSERQKLLRATQQKGAWAIPPLTGVGERFAPRASGVLH
jgi:transposase